ncbi:MAG TPA: PKD domain-containing protein, partial [bacterium]|nr:PKD domain-containing protein [bacterium]
LAGEDLERGRHRLVVGALGEAVVGVGHLQGPEGQRGEVAAAPAEGEHLALLKVRDSRTPNDNISPSTSGIDAGATGDLVYFPLDEYATYQTLRYTVAPAVDPNQPPVAALSTNPNPPVITQGGSVTFNAGTSSDPDGAIVSYEWDFDYQPGSPVWTPGTATPPAQVFPTPGTYTVAVQVTDDGTPPLTDIETVAVTVNPPPPVSNKAVWAAYPSGGIMRGNADGTGATVINGSGRYPRISADGNTVVFSAGAGIGGSLYVWRQSTGVMLIRAQADDPQGYGFRADEVDLSADGSKVVYTDARAGANPPKDCWISDWNGANLVRLTPNDGGCHEMPKIAANGSMVVLYKRSTGRVLKVNPNGTGLTDIGPCTDGPPFLNATGTTVYVKRTFNTLWKTDIDGNNAVSIRTVGNYFAVAANESKVVYDGGGQSVWLANLDGTGTPIQLLNPSVDGYNGWFVSINNDGTWAGWGGLLNRGGTYDVANGLKYQAPAVFANQLYDGVTVGPVGMF